ncbi:Asp23/Gls24 family envelope stress response protein [Streptomyces lavendulocolor]|uniref:Asp23/Gls24 family envelope stress response protein n=1 Tax=Streptomyces lavendulocolor TaxID=67316 RepID=UPI003C2AF6D7
MTGVLAAERGATTIADRVVAKIAARAAREALEGVPAQDDGAGAGAGGAQGGPGAGGPGAGGPGEGVGGSGTNEGAREGGADGEGGVRGPGAGVHGRPPHAAVVVHRDTARVRISLELVYPCDIGAQCAAVRRQVTRRVRTLAGLEVPQVAVQVERLHSPYTRERGKSGGRVR